LDELLSQREKLNIRLQSILDQHTAPWGVKVTMVEVIGEVPSGGARAFCLLLGSFQK
jgi:regulator of protease activity HflC (stomatin/prohibitin superfamily)